MTYKHRPMRTTLLISLIIFVPLFCAFGKNQISFYDLRAEYKTTPINIDVKHPGLSWKITATERNTLQDYFQIQATILLPDAQITYWYLLPFLLNNHIKATN